MMMLYAFNGIAMHRLFLLSRGPFMRKERTSSASYRASTSTRRGTDLLSWAPIGTSSPTPAVTTTTAPAWRPCSRRQGWSPNRYTEVTDRVVSIKASITASSSWRSIPRSRAASAVRSSSGDSSCPEWWGKAPKSEPSSFWIRFST